MDKILRASLERIKALSYTQLIVITVVTAVVAANALGSIVWYLLFGVYGLDVLVPVTITAHLVAIPILAFLAHVIRELKQSNDDLETARCRFLELNETLEQRIDERTAGLKRSEQQFRDLVEQYPSGVYVQVDGHIVFANSQAARQVGAKSAEALAGLLSMHLFDPRDHERIRARHAKAAIQSDPASFEVYCGRRLNGDPYDLEAASTEIVWEGAPALLVVIRDVTERLAMERSLADARDRAEQSERAKSQFLANMSHEIRTPMNGVLGMVDLLTDTELNPTQQRYLSVIRGSGKTLMTVINDILDLSKIEAGKLTLESEPLDVRGVVNDVIELFSEIASAKSVMLSTALAEGLPRAVCGDVSRLRQILGNLVSNAIKFTASGGSVELRASSSPREDGNVRLVFEIEDSGIGIEPDRLDRLFEAFEQADGSTSRRYGGTGLGLAIVSEIVEMMGGRVAARSELGQGSVFTISITVPVASETTTAASNAEAPSDAVAQTRFDAKILVAEDNLVNQEVTRAVLEGLGCDVTIENDGSRTFDAWKREMFDLILMDCQMPEMDGFDAAALIRNAEKRSNASRRTPIVALTAHVLEEDRDRCREAGMDDYLSKPFDKSSLVTVLKRWLGERNTNDPERASQTAA